MDNTIQIDAIELKNFRGQTGRYETDGNQVHFFTGPNGAGKSSILDAVRLAMLGRCRGTTASGAGFKSLIGEDEEFASVKLYGHIIDGDKFFLSVHIRSKLQGKVHWLGGTDCDSFSGTLSDTVDAFWRRVGARNADCALWPEQFLDSKALGNALSDRFRGEIDTGAALVTDDLEVVFDIGILVKAANIDPTEVSGLVALGGFAYDKRTLVNRDIKRLEMLVIEPQPDMPKGLIFQPDKTYEAIQNAESLIVKLTGEREEALALIARASVPVKVVTNEVLANMRVGRGMLATELSRLQELQAQAVEQVEEEDGNLESRKGETRKDQDRIVAIDARLAELSEPSLEMCNVCNRKFTKAQLESRAKAATHERETLETERPTYVAGATGGAQAMPSYQKAVDAARSVLASADEQVAHTRTLLDDAKRDLEDATKRQGEQRDPIDASGSVEKAAELEQRIEKGRAVVAYLESTNKRQADREELKGLQRQVAALTWTIDRFHGGAWLKSEMLKCADPWIGTVNRVLEPFGYCLALDMGKKEIALRFRSKVDGPFYDIELASKGERVILAAGIALAFADGGVVLLDDIDGLDGVNKRRFFSILKESIAEVGTVYLAGAWALSAKYNGKALEHATGFGCHWVT